MALNVQITGIDALREQLNKFPVAFQNRVIAKGVRKAAAHLRTAMRRAAYAAPMAKGYKRTNKLRKALQSSVGKKAANKGKAWVGLRTIRGESKARSYYAALEHGRQAYASKKRGAVKGSPPMRPFFAKTWNAQKATVGRMLVEETAKALAYEAGKAYGRARGRK